MKHYYELNFIYKGQDVCVEIEFGAERDGEIYDETIISNDSEFSNEELLKFIWADKKLLNKLWDSACADMEEDDL